MKKELSCGQFKSHRDDMDGFCTNCNQVTTFGGIEPDAEQYECEECGEFSLYGMDYIIMNDMIIIRPGGF